MGIVVRARNIGATVRAFSIAEVEEVYEVREIVQRQAALRVRLPAAPEDIARIEAIHADYVRCVEAGDLRGIHTNNDRFHIAIFELCGNAYLLALVRQYMDLTYVIRTNTFSDAAALQRTAPPARADDRSPQGPRFLGLRGALRAAPAAQQGGIRPPPARIRGGSGFWLASRVPRTRWLPRGLSRRCRPKRQLPA